MRPADGGSGNCLTIPIPQYATSTPAAPPISASTALSVRCCRATRHVPAPSDRRTASSRRRTIPRASRRFATFAQAMISTRPATSASQSDKSPAE